MKKRIFLGAMIILTAVGVSGCGNLEDDIIKSNYSDAEPFADREDTADREDNENMNHAQENDRGNDENETAAGLDDFNEKTENSTDERQKEDAGLSDIPTIDEEVAGQFAESQTEERKGFDPDKVIVSLKDITSEKLIVYYENLNDIEVDIAVRDIHLTKENQDAEWDEINKRPYVWKVVGLPPGDFLEIEYDIVKRYGELSKGEYVCVVGVGESKKEITFEIE